MHMRWRIRPVRIYMGIKIFFGVSREEVVSVALLSPFYRWTLLILKKLKTKPFVLQSEIVYYVQNESHWEAQKVCAEKPGREEMLLLIATEGGNISYGERCGRFLSENYFPSVVSGVC